MGLFDFLFGQDMTANYIGKHGEFNRNDADLKSHFGWENKLNYDSDGYKDEEYW